MSDIYINVYSAGPLIIVRVPGKGKRGKKKPAPPWRDIKKGFTEIMLGHGMLQKDISSIDALCHPDQYDPDPKDPWIKEREINESRSLLEKLVLAFRGGDQFAKFWLYDWDEHRGSFSLARGPVDDRTSEP